ncbi:FtsW/RodA/SpoVE family cell cycle protein [Bacillus badius]|uniref:Probable peptidoglycan glycosyltransferase FtsW n=1 Tax=Bacillus badius TaxID=1455 RepID=A0ABR5B0G6_BACBA|nr:FtsW/RodA/SpoVE family cell cycle protein [Bacillus badius]KIL73433.1 Cell division protein FtsW [Bacillus badius]KIL80442.1 Cell division protein FtsW [Bacillus badius]KZO01548.1 cell division protein FtsW [Bacillus badius]KZR57259.1 cell division protein FtsW [Bacillus badius]MED0667191.1 FtsW/RodA/SpoVE family cell cycle protein [Bacillus badius]
MWKKIIRSYDYSLIAAFFLLCLFGLMMIYSASSVTAVQRYEVASDYFYNKQKIHIIAASVFFFAAALFPYKAYKNSKFLFAIVAGIIGMLVALMIFGTISNNARSWIRFGGMNLQPSEFAKLVIIIYMSAIYAKKQKYINSFNKGVTPPVILLVFLCTLIAAEPDFGTAFIIFLIGCTIIISSGMRFKSMWKLVVLGLMAALVLSPLILLKKDKIFTEEKISRITGYLDPFEHQEGDGYHLVNSYLAIGSGGVTGNGLGQSVQKLGYLPEPHTDFIMAVISEELGLLGVFIVIGGLSFIVLKGIYISIKCQDPFGKMMAVGISSMIAIQAAINLGGVTGLIPITGVPLPLISYGGSSLILLSVSLGVLVNISMFTKYEQLYKK